MLHLDFLEMSVEDPISIHSCGGRGDYAPNVSTCPTRFLDLLMALNPHALFLLHALENLKSKRTDSCYQTVNSQALMSTMIPRYLYQFYIV